MIRGLRPLLLGLPLSLLPACEHQSSSSVVVQDLPPGVVARVGGELIDTAQFEAVQARGDQARAKAVVADTLLAVEARSRDPHRAAVIERSVLSRALRETLRAEHLAASPPSKVEVQRAVESNWLVHSRPRAVRAVVARVAVPTMGRDQPYAAEARRIARQCAGSTSVNALKACIKEGDVSADLLRVPPLDEKGRVVPAHAADRTLPAPPPDLARAIGRLQAPGDATRVVPGSDDYQVAIATEVVAADPVDTPEEAEQVLAGLASDAVRRQTTSLVTRSTTTVMRTKKNEAALLRLVWRR